MTVYKVMRPISLQGKSQSLDVGDYVSDKGKYDGVKEYDGVIFCEGGIDHLSQTSKNVLIPYIIEAVDHIHTDYERLVEVGVIQSKPKVKKDKS